MTITAIRSTGATAAFSASNSVNVSFGTLPVAGHGIAVFAWGSGATNTTGNSCTDNQGVGNVYTLIASAANTLAGLDEVAIWVCPAIGATSGTFTLTVKVATAFGATLAGAEEFSALVLPVDVTASSGSQATTTTPVSGTTAATAQADEVALIVLRTDTGQVAETISTPTNYTEVCHDLNDSGHDAGAADFRILSATGTQSASWTVGHTGSAGACIAVVKGAAGSTDPFPAGYYQHPRAYLRM